MRFLCLNQDLRDYRIFRIGFGVSWYISSVEFGKGWVSEVFPACVGVGLQDTVIPAKAGIQGSWLMLMLRLQARVDSRFRGNDGTFR